MYWAHLICIEFHDQTVKEKELNVEVTDFLKFDSLLYFFKNQSNFASNGLLYFRFYRDAFVAVFGETFSINLTKIIH